MWKRTQPLPTRCRLRIRTDSPLLSVYRRYICSTRTLTRCKTEVALSLAYIRDPGNYQPVSPVVNASAGGSTGTNELPPAPPAFVGPSAPPTPLTVNYTALDTNHDGKLEPNEYLPPSPYLTLRSAAYLTTGQTSLAATAAKEDASSRINGVLGADIRWTVPDTQHPGYCSDSHQYQETNVVPLIAQAAVGPVTLTFPHYNVVALAGAVAEGSDGAGGVFQSVPAAVTVDTPPPPRRDGRIGRFRHG